MITCAGKAARKEVRRVGGAKTLGGIHAMPFAGVIGDELESGPF